MVRLVAELNKEALSGWMYGFADIVFLHFAKVYFVFVNTGPDEFHDDGAGGLINRQKRAGVWKGKK